MSVNENEQQPEEALRSFFNELTTHLDVGMARGTALSVEQSFSGPDGMICRVEARQDGADVVARPQVLLPLDDAEIRELEVGRLLSVQSTLLSELGWVLGHSHEGLLQIAPLQWTPQALEVARELDLGSAVGSMVLAVLKSGATGLEPDAGH
jgi:hypothetical protein